jgi:hypothetical protein
MLLQLAVAVLERVEVIPKSQCGCHINRVARQLLGDLNLSPVAGCAGQLPIQPLGRDTHHVEVAL